MKKAAIYIRVSTDAQAEEGYSIDAQKEQLSAYCVSKGIKNYEFYIDGGWSGSNIDRPEIKRLIKDAQAGKLSHCIVYKLDRLSRSQKDTLYLIEDIFNPNNVDFVSLNESMDTSTPMGRLMLGILSAFAQLERENISMRTKMGMKERVKSGLWMGGGRVPFGYDYDKNQGILVPNKDAEKVKKIYQMYIDGMSPQAIADIYDLKYDRIIVQILKRRINYGVIEYNGEIYESKHEPIISKETYDLAMEHMKKRSVNRNIQGTKLLTGLLYCGCCGAKMRYQQCATTTKSKGRIVYGDRITCYSHQKSKKYLIKDENCTQENLWAKDIEEEVIKAIFSFKEEQTKINEKNIIVDVLEELADSYDKTVEKIKKLYKLYVTDNNDILLDTIEEEKENLAKIEKMIQAEEDKINQTERIDELSSYIEDTKELWEHMSQKERIYAINLIVNKITITHEDLYIDLNIY